MIYTKNTELLLNSIKKNAAEHFNPIIIAASHTNMVLMTDEFNNVDMVVDDGIFSTFVIDVLEDSDNNNVGFTSDSMVIYKPLPRNIPDLYPGEVFSLKLGLNTTKQDEYNNIMQPKLTNYLDDNMSARWT